MSRIEKSCKSTASVTVCISCGWNIGPGTFCGFRHTPTHLDPFSLTGEFLQNGHSSLVGLKARRSMTCISTSSADAMVPGKYPDPDMFLSVGSSVDDDEARSSAGIVLRAALLLADVLLCRCDVDDDDDDDDDDVEVAPTDLDVATDAAAIMITRANVGSFLVALRERHSRDETDRTGARRALLSTTESDVCVRAFVRVRRR